MNSKCTRNPWLGFLLWTLTVTQAFGQEASARKGPLLGAISKDQAFVTIRTPDPTPGSKVFDVALLYAKLPNGVAGKRPTGSWTEHLPDRWRISQDHLWLVSSYKEGFTGSTLDSLEGYWLPDLQKGKHSSRPNEGVDLGPFVLRGPVSVARSAEIWLRAEMYYDYLPISAHKLRLFLLTNVSGSFLPAEPRIDIDITERETTTPKWSLTVFGYQAKWGRLFWKEGEWTEIERISVSFTEPFHVYAKDSTYFFVTVSGKVYIAKKPEKGERKTEPLWTDAKQPIVAIISDADRGKTFVFGKPAIDATIAKEFFFELDEKPDVRYFDRASIKPVKNEDPLKAVMEYAQLIRGSSKPEK